MTASFARVHTGLVLFGCLLLYSRGITAHENLQTYAIQTKSERPVLFKSHPDTNAFGISTNLKVAQISVQRKATFSKAKSAHRNGNYDRAFSIWLALAAEGDAPSQFAIAIYFHKGYGRVVDIGKALTWYYRSALGGYTPAMLNLGIAHWTGWGVPKDHKLAVSWWRQGADNGGVSSQYNLGIAYLSGDGVNQNIDEAIYWLTQSASNGSEKALDVLQSLFTRYPITKQPYLLDA